MPPIGKRLLNATRCEVGLMYMHQLFRKMTLERVSLRKRFTCSSQNSTIAHHDHNPRVDHVPLVLGRVAGQPVVRPQVALPLHRLVVASEGLECYRRCRRENLQKINGKRRWGETWTHGHHDGRLNAAPIAVHMQIRCCHPPPKADLSWQPLLCSTKIIIIPDCLFERINSETARPAQP